MFEHWGSRFPEVLSGRFRVVATAIVQSPVPTEFSVPFYTKQMLGILHCKFLAFSFQKPVKPLLETESLWTEANIQALIYSRAQPWNLFSDWGLSRIHAPLFRCPCEMFRACAVLKIGLQHPSVLRVYLLAKFCCFVVVFFSKMCWCSRFQIPVPDLLVSSCSAEGIWTLTHLPLETNALILFFEAPLTLVGSTPWSRTHRVWDQGSAKL